MAGIKELRDRQARWQSERFVSGQRYFPRNGDIVFFHFMSTGEDSDPYFELFDAHEIPAQVQGGRPTLKYCPFVSKMLPPPGYRCPYCEAQVRTKARMAFWMYVHSILHTTLRQGEVFETTAYQGRNYFRQDVNDTLLWDTSAWIESPADDILNLWEQIGSAHAYMFTLRVSGDQLQRRYKVYIEQGSQGFQRETYEQAKLRCRPVIEVLNEQLAVPTEQRPTPTVAPTAGGIQPATVPFAPPDGGVLPFTPSAVPPPFAVPGGTTSGTPGPAPTDEEMRRIF